MVGSLAVAAPESEAATFDLLFVDQDGAECREPLASAWNVRFESVPPVREFGSYRGQRHFSGLWWLATTGDHVGFESWLERDRVMVLDFAADVVALASQPFWLRWSQADSPRRHAPDFFARLADGTGVVIDVRADDRIKPKDAEAFAATASACESVGWSYRRVGALDPVLAANLRWLSGYRHRRCHNTDVAAGLRDAFGAPAPLLDGARVAGDPIAVLPTLFHLLWTHVLVADVRSAPLSGGSLIRLAGCGS